MNKKLNKIPFEQYKNNWMYMLSEANKFNQCDCQYCLKLKHTATVLMNYLRVAWDLKSLDDKIDIGYIDELVDLYLDYFHVKLSCNIISNVIKSIETTLAYYNTTNKKWVITI